ncbi:MAG: hypothetical protein IJ220_04640 [Clostridia bacterium]|nr:hypothetical protein [Clostridia bacterium]
MLNKDSYISIEFISGNLKTKNELVNTDDLQFIVARVYDWYDEKIVLSGRGEIIDSVLYFKINNGLEKGLYELLAIKDSNGVTLIGNENNNCNPIAAYTVNAHNKKSALLICKEIHDMREREFNKPKYICKKEKAKPFDVFVFCKNIKIDVTAQYEDIQIFPYEYLKMTSEVDYINSFFKNIINMNLEVKYEKFEHELPSAVFHISNIMALDYEQAKRYALKRIDFLNSVYTVLLGSHGTYFSIVTLNKEEKMSQISMCNTRYKGNLFLFAENGFNIKQFYKYIKNDKGYLSVYLKLLVEAKNEDNRMLKYYRYWNILEGIASLKKYEQCEMKKWDGSNVYNKSGNKILVGNEALNIVFELIRNYFSEQSEETFLGQIENINSVKEFLGICYQRRNCCAHRGECYSNDKKICLVTNSSMCTCHNKNIIHKNEPIQFQDKILRKIEEITIQLLLKELKKGVGNFEKEEIEICKALDRL